jgi:hypothetical protein
MGLFSAKKARMSLMKALATAGGNSIGATRLLGCVLTNALRPLFGADRKTFAKRRETGKE